jgi:hypothetical protein
MKVMVCHFVSNSHEVMTALIVVLPIIVVVEISLQLHQAVSQVLTSFSWRLVIGCWLQALDVHFWIPEFTFGNLVRNFESGQLFFVETSTLFIPLV